MFDLMQFAGRESDVIWIDDRWIQSHEHRDGMRIVGTVDLLSWLRDAEKMSPTDFAQALNDMRAADVRLFVAFDADELVAALREAPIEDGMLVETRTLRVLRQYYARCLLEADVLRPPTEGRWRCPTQPQSGIFLRWLWPRCYGSHGQGLGHWLTRSCDRADRVAAKQHVYRRSRFSWDCRTTDGSQRCLSCERVADKFDRGLHSPGWAGVPS